MNIKFILLDLLTHFMNGPASANGNGTTKKAKEGKKAD
jgi:hypothetical protein